MGLIGLKDLAWLRAMHLILCRNFRFSRTSILAATRSPAVEELPYYSVAGQQPYINAVAGHESENRRGFIALQRALRRRLNVVARPPQYRNKTRFKLTLQLYSAPPYPPCIVR